MEHIDADWIKARLTGARGEKTQLAAAVGITAKQLSYILGGTRKVQQEEAQHFINFFGEAAAPAPATGFAEPEVAFIAPKPNTRAELVLKLAAEAGRHPQLYRITSGETDGGMIQGDIAIVDLKGAAQIGDSVICTLTDPQTGASVTRIRTWYDPWLVSRTAHDKLDNDTGNAAILGTVIASLRGIDL